MPNAEWIHSDLKFFCIRFQKEGRQAALNFLRFEPFLLHRNFQNPTTRHIKQQ